MFPVISAANAQTSPLPKAGFLRVLVMPLLAFAYGVAYPEHLGWTCAFLVAPFLVDVTEAFSPPELRTPLLGKDAPGSPLMGALVVVLFVLHWLTLGVAAWRMADGPLLSLRALTLTVLLVMASSLSGAVTGHELIHRSSTFRRSCGRLLLASLWFEHFANEHLRGHHAHAGEHDDIGTARLGETFLQFLRRAMPGQFGRALCFERERLKPRPRLTRLVGNRVYQGLLVEVLLTALFFVMFGPRGGALFLLQAVVVSVLFQAVSYIEHWGLDEHSGAVAWDTDKRSSLFSMLGLSRHADHHAHPGRAFHELAYRKESPQLPYGYASMLGLVLLRNAKFRAVMTEALRRQGLLREPARTDEAHWPTRAA